MVFLGQTPDRVYDIESRGLDLYLAGPTHGGQVALPLYGALWTNSAYGQRFERGLSRVGETWLYVNRGIGMTAYLPKIRFLSRPEITVIDIGPVNERVSEDPSLLVQANPSDPPRPYPTAKQYAGWAELIGAYVREALEGIEP